MLRTRKRTGVCVVLIVLNLAFIWGNSLLPGSISGAISTWVGDVIRYLFDLPVNETEGGGHLLRKLAHFSEFACLGFLLCWLAGMLGEVGFHLASMPLFGGLAAACVDETIQLFIAGRGSSLKDVWIDTAGAAAGILILLIGHHYIKNKKVYFWRKQQ